MTESEAPYLALDKEASSSKVYPPIVVPVPTLPFMLRQVSLNAPDILAFSYAINTLAAALMLGMPGTLYLPNVPPFRKSQKDYKILSIPDSCSENNRQE